MSKCIWYVTKYFSPKTTSSPGGRGWFLMKELAEQGHRPVVISSDSNNLVALPTLSEKVEFQRFEGVELVWLKTLKYTTAKSLKRILSWFHFEWNLFNLDKSSISRPDAIVVSSLSLLTILNGVLLKRKYRCPLIFEIRDIWPLTIVEEGGVSPRHPFVLFLGFIERLGYLKSDSIIGTMPNLKKHVSKVLGRDKLVHCIPMGVDSTHLDNQKKLSKSYVDKYLSSGKFKVVHCGTIGITNALDTFFMAAKAMQDNDDIEFILIGDGALKQSYMDKYGMQSNITFAPKVDRNEVQDALSYCNVVYFSVFRSEVWEYGQSLNKVIDYMLSAKPIIASYSGYPSMINESKCGTFVAAEEPSALQDAIMKYSSMSSDELESIGRKGHSWLLEHRSYKKLSKSFLQACFPE